MSNSIDSALLRDTILSVAVQAFAKAIAPLHAFTSVFYDTPLDGTGTVQIPYLPAESASSTAYSSAYVAGDSSIDHKPVVIDQRLYQSFQLTSAEMRRQPVLSVAKMAQQKAKRLAYDCFATIWALVKAADFTQSVTAGASVFDDIASAKLLADKADWPPSERAVLLNEDLDAVLLKDSRMAYRQDQVLGASYFPVNGLPDNSESLKGCLVHPSALLVCLAPIPPCPEVAKKCNYKTATDPVTGITLEMRSFGNASTDASIHILEVNFGAALGNTDGLIRIV